MGEGISLGTRRGPDRYHCVSRGSDSLGSGRAVEPIAGNLGL